MSLVILVSGRALNSSQFQDLTGRGPSLSVKFQFSVRRRGVGPADSTGKSSVSTCPGGSRALVSGACGRPKNPRVAIEIILGNRVRLLIPAAGAIANKRGDFASYRPGTANHRTTDRSGRLSPGR